MSNAKLNSLIKRCLKIGATLEISSTSIAIKRDGTRIRYHYSQGINNADIFHRLDAFVEDLEYRVNSGDLYREPDYKED